MSTNEVNNLIGPPCRQFNKSTNQPKSTYFDFLIVSLSKTPLSSALHFDLHHLFLTAEQPHDGDGVGQQPAELSADVSDPPT